MRAFLILSLPVIVIAAIILVALRPVAPERPREATAERTRTLERDAFPSASSRAGRIEPQSCPEDRGDATDDTTMIIEVVREDGLRVRDAIILLDGRRLSEEGYAELPAKPGKTAEIRAVAPNAIGFTTTITLDPGRHAVVIPTRSQLAGRLLVDGREPKEPIEIWFDPAAEQARSTTTGRDGRFEFYNLPFDCSGFLLLPNELALEEPMPRMLGASIHEVDDSDSARRKRTVFRVPHLTLCCGSGGRMLPKGWKLEVDQPDPNLEIRLVQTPVIKGRLFRQDDPDFHGAGEFTLETKPWSPPKDHPLQCEWWSGKFSFRVGPEVEKVTLIVYDEFGLGRTRFDLQGPFQGITDLGDLEVMPTRMLAVHVVDGGGKPIEKAQAFVAGSTSNSGPTDADGIARVPVTNSVETVVVGALGYALAEVAISPQTVGPVEVILHPTNQLIVEVRHPDGGVARHWDGVYVNVSGSVPLFASELDYSPHIAAGANEQADQFYAGVPEDSMCGYEVNWAGQVVIVGLTPGNDVRVQLRSSKLDELLDETHVVMGPTGESRVALTIPPSSTFEGLVRDVDGRPVANADVVVKGAEHGGGGFLTDAEGRFHVERVFLKALGIAISVDGFADLELPNVVVGSADEVHTFTLAPASK